MIVTNNGGAGNRLSAAASLELIRPGLPKLHRQAEWGYGYLTANDPRVHFGLGDYAGQVTVRAIWPDGGSEVFRFDGVDRIASIRRGTGGQ